MADIFPDFRNSRGAERSFQVDRLVRNVLIIDDEKIIRQGLRMSVPWEELGFKVVAEAETAMEGMQRLEQFRIDLALVDVQMPGMNGIEFIRTIRKDFPYLKILIISGHSDFEYVSSALKLDVSDYLLKPVNIRSLKEAVNNIRLKMDEEAQKTQVTQEQKTISRKMLALGLLSGDFDNLEAIENYCSRCAIAFPLQNYGVVSMSLQSFHRVLEKNFSNRRADLEAYFTDKLSEELQYENDLFFSVLMGRYYAVIVKSECMETVQRILYEAAEQREMKILLGVGDTYESINFIHVSYMQSVERIGSLENRSRSKPESAESKIIYYSRLLVQQMEERDFESVIPTVRKLFSENLDSEPGKLLSWCINSLYYISDYFQLNYYPEMKNIAVINIQTMSTFYFFTSLQKAYEEKMEQICRFFQKMNGKGNEEIVRNVCRIVREEYGNPGLSLQEIAERQGISYNYLCMIFKQISGKNFSGYLTEVKMARAKQMILEGKWKMYEIAETVGYTNAKYFTEQFKKTVGMTPKEYRRQADKNSREEV